MIFALAAQCKLAQRVLTRKGRENLPSLRLHCTAPPLKAWPEPSATVRNPFWKVCLLSRMPGKAYGQRETQPGDCSCLSAQVWREHGLRYGQKQQQHHRHVLPSENCCCQPRNWGLDASKMFWTVRSTQNKAGLAEGGQMDTEQVSLGVQRGCWQRNATDLQRWGKTTVTFGT